MKTLSFPFYFVCCWIKPCVQDKHQCCKCDKKAQFVHEDYTDTSSLREAMQRDFDAFRESIDSLWARTIQEQMQGTYTKHDTYHCKACSHRVVARWANDVIADVSLSSMLEETGISGLMLGCRVKSLEDNGDSLVMATKASTIEELAEHLRGEVVSIHRMS